MEFVEYVELRLNELNQRVDQLTHIVNQLSQNQGQSAVWMMIPPWAAQRIQNQLMSGGQENYDPNFGQQQFVPQDFGQQQGENFAFSHSPKIQGGGAQQFAVNTQFRAATLTQPAAQESVAKAGQPAQAADAFQRGGAQLGQFRNPGGLAGSHVNSGPTRHSDNGGFSDFSRQANPGALASNPALRNPGGLAGSHVNSGPTRHSDNGGFSDFGSRVNNPSQVLTNPALRNAGQITNPGQLAGSHVNSGPTRHSDNGGFSDFSSRAGRGAAVSNPGDVSIGGTQVGLAQGQQLRVGDYVLTRLGGGLKG